MAQDEFKRAITLLKLLSFEDLLTAQQVLETQVQYIDNEILNKERRRILFALSAKKEDRKLFNLEPEASFYDQRDSVGFLISDIQRIMNKIKLPLTDLIKAASVPIDGSFDENIYNLDQSLKDYLSAQNDIHDREAIFIINGLDIWSSSLEVIKQYIAMADEVIKGHATNTAIDVKFDKLLKLKANHAANIIKIKKNIQQTLLDIASAKHILHVLSGKSISLQDFLSMTFYEMRSSAANV